jgi:cytoskeletal protein CcmA (bactofilin family)
VECGELVRPACKEKGTQVSKIYDELKRAEYARHASNIVGGGVCVNGEISGNEDLLVEGIVEGLIELGDGVLTVAATGRVAADVVAREVVVYGEMRGNIAARERIEIMKDALMVGDVSTGRIIIEEGADFRGLMEIISRETLSHTPPAAANSPGQAYHSRAMTAAG